MVRPRARGRRKRRPYKRAPPARLHFISDIRLENIRVAGQRLKTLDEFIIFERGDVSNVTLK